ncbi:activating transcription factor 7-interacting protein 1-like isoform X2 [Cloeon dipterum]|uniref:activating transcription factor 7-interacting protein 1-like isoform X2 n=1 Tax=Cloeon dipterum TaxID=197152 RepID=UPI00321FD223
MVQRYCSEENIIPESKTKKQLVKVMKDLHEEKQAESRIPSMDEFPTLNLNGLSESDRENSQENREPVIKCVDSSNFAVVNGNCDSGDRLGAESRLADERLGVAANKENESSLSPMNDLNDDARSAHQEEEPEDDIRLVMEDELERKSDPAYDGSEGGDENKAPSEDLELEECTEREFVDDLQENDGKSYASDNTLVEEDVNAVDREKNGDENSNPPSEAVISISSTPIDIADSTNNFDCADEEPEVSPRKRPASTTDKEVAVKKIKIETADRSAEMSVQEDAQLVKTMTRDELAKLLIDAFITSKTRKSELATMEHELVKLRLKCDSYKKKITTLTKQCMDIQNSVAQVAESNKSNAKALKPKPIVRHVAVQVPSKNIGITPQPEKKVKTITPINRVPLPQQPNTIITKASPKPAAVKSPQGIPTLKAASRQVLLTKTTPAGAVVTTTPASQGMVAPLRLTSKSTTPPNPPVRTIGQTTMRNGQTTMKGSDTAAPMQFMQSGNRIIIPNSTGLQGMQQTKQPVAYLISNSNNGNMLLQSQMGGILLNKASPSAETIHAADGTELYNNAPTLHKWHSKIQPSPETANSPCTPAVGPFHPSAARLEATAA